MRIRNGFLGLAAFGLVASQVSAQSIQQTSFLFRRPATCDTCGTPTFGPLTTLPADPSKPSADPSKPGDPNQAPLVDAQDFAQAPAAGAEGGTSFNPAMFGDLGASSRGYTYVSAVSHYGSSSIIYSNLVQAPLVGTASSFKISDNESPRPTDRVFFTYNYFDRISSNPNVGLNRELIGFEKTFLDGDASFGMRLPFLQTTSGGGAAGFPDHEVGDITLISKFALINNLDTGNLVSTGLVLTVPSADHTFVLSDGTALRSVLFQPYVGWIYNSEDLFFQGFHSLVFPTDSRDISEFNNDIAVGYWLYRNNENLLRGIVPTIEGHLFTPFNHRSKTDIINSSNIFTLTMGVNAVLPGNSTVGLALGVPLTGPKPDSVEVLFSMNFRF